MKKVIRLTESDLRRIVKQVIKESSMEEVRVLMDEIDNILDDYQYDLNKKVRKYGLLDYDESTEIFSDFTDDIHRFLKENGYDEMSGKGYFFLEDYVDAIINNFNSFLNELTD